MTDASLISLMPAGADQRRLQVVYADASATSVGAWRLAIGFAAPPAWSDSDVKPVPPSAIQIRHDRDDGERAELEVVHTFWTRPGKLLTADVVLRGASIAARSYALRIDFPEVIDPAVASAEFVSPDAPPQATAAAPSLDYLTKDYYGFRQLMLTTINRLMPSWQDGAEADIGVTIVESLAYAADFLSYYQDAVATEAYVDTARQRKSIRRHLRLLGYTLGEGCASRVAIRLMVSGAEELLVPSGCAYMAAPELPAVVQADGPDIDRQLKDGRAVYTQMQDATLRPSLNHLPLAVETAMLRAGCIHYPVLAPEVTHLPKIAPGRLFGVIGCRSVGGAPVLHPFRVREVRATTSGAVGGRRLYILVADHEDALPWNLWLHGAAGVTGNLVIAEFGRIVSGEQLPLVPTGSPYQPTLAEPYLVHAAPMRADASASALLHPDPKLATAAITLRQFLPADSTVPPPVGLMMDGAWRAASDLLQSSSNARRFVAEPDDDDGATMLRFGDGVFGRRPAPGTGFLADYRVGQLPAAVIGQSLLDTLVAPRGAAGAPLLTAVRSVTNPIPSKGLVQPQAESEAIMQAKAAFRIIKTCVTPADYAAVAEGVAGVAEAVVAVRRAGAFEAIVVRVRSTDDLFVPEDLLRRVRSAYAGRLLPGRRLVIDGPRFARLRIAVRVRSVAGASVEMLRGRIEDRFSAAADGLFSPSHVSFGEPVFSSRLLEALLEIEGVARAQVVELRRVGDPSASDGVAVSLAADEIPTLGDLRIDVEPAS